MDFSTQLDSFGDLFSIFPTDISTAVIAIIVFLLALAVARIIL